MDGIVRCPLVPNELEIPDVTFGSLLFDGIRDHSAPALVDVLTGVKVSRSEFLQKSESIAQHLVTLGCHRGDVIAIFAHNSVEWVTVAAAALRVEAVLSGMNSLLTSGELLHQLNICRPKFLFTDESLLGVVNDVIKKSDHSAIQIIVKGATSEYIRLDSLLCDKTSHVMLPTLGLDRPKLDDPCLILFSSGTTGLQKGVYISHRNAIFASAVLRHPLMRVINQKTVVFTPLSHITGILSALASLLSGYTVYLLTRFDFEIYLKTLSENNITEMFVVPPIATMFAKSALIDKYQIRLTQLNCGAGLLSQEVQDLLRQRFPKLTMRQFYGMTETCGGTIGVPTNIDTSSKLGSVGVPMFNCQIKIIDIATAKTLGPNETGEICVKSPMNMIGYVNNAAATLETIDQDGWLHSGDLGYYDSDGYFYVTDRIKELIKYNAYQVAPAELEAVLLSHPDVADAAVIGLPDLSAGELPMACVVRQPSSTVTELELQKFVEGKVAPFKKLRGGIKFVATIPRNASGKILRRIIKTGLLEGKL